MKMKEFFLGILSISIIGFSACAFNEHGNDNKDSSEPDDSVSWIESCGNYPELCVPLCQRSAKQCAEKLNKFLTTKSPSGGFLFQSWPVFPNETPFKSNESTPMHGSYLTVFVNDIAKTYIDSVLQKYTDGSLDYVDFPNGSIIVKQNFILQSEDKPWLTVMWKLDGYCHGKFGAAGPCTGGEWFYYLSRFGEFHDFNGQPAYGKAQAFCADCHGPVQKADYLWSLFEQLKALSPAISSVPSEQAAKTNVVNFCEGTPLTPIVPGDVAQNPMQVMKSMGPEKAQLMFDCLSWRSFIALNWPAKAGQRGKPNIDDNLSNNNSPRVWETYREIFEIFQPANPNWKLDSVNWNSQQHLNPVCDASIDRKVLRMTSKNRASPVLNETHQAFGNQFNILVDQNGNQLHYEVLVNRDEFDFFKANKYANTGNYDVGGPLSQLSWQAKPLHFPDNIRGDEGAIEIKAAWRVMCTDSSCTTKDDPSRYYTRNVQIYEPNADGGTSCTSTKVGLVGMHIGHKTFWTPQWVWSTFEHLDNVPPVDGPTKPNVQYGLYSETSKKNQPDNATCASQRPGALPASTDANVINCPNNQLICNSHPDAKNGKSAGSCSQQKFLSSKQNPKATDLIPNQVTRIDKISDSPLNSDYPKALSAYNSPLANYRLVNTQWPIQGRGNPIETTINMRVCQPNSNSNQPCYSLAPKGLKLRNTTMETFQVTYLNPTNHPDGQTSSAGCMQCHGVAGLDFSFAWTDAAEEVVTIVQDNLSDPPAGTYLQSCNKITMTGGTLNASCRDNNGVSNNSKPLNNAHLCSGDIANINGQLLCNPPVGSFVLTCEAIDIKGDVLSANCKTNAGELNPTNLIIRDYNGVIENCDGLLTKGRCV